MGRFIAIFAISALGAGFFAGIRVTGLNMRSTADWYYHQQNLADFTLLSTMGFTEDDVSALRGHPEFGQVDPGYALDLLLENPLGALPVHVMSFPGTQQAKDSQQLTQPLLTAGRMPTAANECLLDARSLYQIGDVLTLSTENEQEVLDLMAQRAFTVVGKAESPQYISIQRGNTNIGDGRIAFFVYLLPQAFDSEFYLSVNLGINNAEQLSSFSAAYQSQIDADEATLKKLAGEREQARYNDIMAEGEEKLAEAQTELADGRKEADEKLGDAWQKILDGEAKITDGWREVNENIKKLADGEADIISGQADLDSARQALAEAEDKYKNGLDAYRRGVNQYNDGFGLYQKNHAEIEALGKGVAALPGMLATTNSIVLAGGPATPTDVEIFSGATTGAAQTASGCAALMAKSADTAAQQAAAQVDSIVTAAKTALEAGQYGVANAALQMLAPFQPAFESTVAGAQAQLASAKKELEKSKKKLDKAEDELEDARLQIADGHRQLEDGQQKLADARAELADGRTKLADARIELADAEKELADGKSEYFDEKAKAEKEIADAQTKIDDAQKKLNDLAMPEWMVMSRDKNPGYSGFDSDALRIESLGRVIPVFFFLVAALVCLTSMTRMVEEQRTHIGTLKALGYPRRKVGAKYMLYAFLASTTGGAAGVLAGYVLFPKAIWNAYRMMYRMPDIRLGGNPALAVSSIFFCSACVLLATLAACTGELRSVPAALMRPKAPKTGKRVFLERIGPLWQNMSFMQKVTARNLFRYKKRFLMTIVGIAGCSALLLTGFGLRDSISGIVPLQYGGINHYNVVAALSEPSDSTADTRLNSELPALGDALFTQEVSVKVSSKNGDSSDMTVYLFVPEKPEKLGEFISLNAPGGQEALPFPQDEHVIITEKLAKRLKAGVGDTIEVSRLDGAVVPLAVGGITENYLLNYIYINPQHYQRTFGAPEYKNLLIKLYGPNADSSQIINRLLGLAPIAGAVDINELVTRFNDMFKSLNSVVSLIIAMAAALAVVVLYNLTNINITERTREIATLKVLGFRSGEVASYVFRENIILTLIGTLAGLVMGYFLHDYVILTAEVDEVMFRRAIELPSYIFSVLFTMLCATVVNLIMRRRLEKINMVESLKSIE